MIRVDLNLDFACFFGKFSPVFQKVVQHLRESCAIAVHPDGNLWNPRREGDAARFKQGTVVFHREPRELRQVETLLVERDQSAGDSRDVKQVVDQPAHVGDLAIHHVANLGDHRRVAAAHAEQVN